MVSLPVRNQAKKAVANRAGLIQTIANMFGGNKKSLARREKWKVNNQRPGVRGDDLMYPLEMDGGPKCQVLI